MSESESEVYYIEEEFEQIKELLKKYQKMQTIKNTCYKTVLREQTKEVDKLQVQSVSTASS